MESKKIQVLKWSVAILAVLNILMLVQNFMKPPLPHGMPPPHDGPAAKIKTDLGFTDDQMSRFEELKTEHQKAMRELHEQGRVLRDTYFDLLKADSADVSTKSGIEKRIGENQEAIEKITFDHFQKVRELCTAEQKVKFDRVIGNILRGMRHHGPPPPPQL
jgi:Spy/CpxP family protein refolding chaperone